MSTIHINEENFNEVVFNTNLPIILDFYADWCSPCKMFAPVLEEIADELDGKAIVAKMNIDESKELATEFGIRTIPTLMLLKDGKMINKIVGIKPKTIVLKEFGF
ncbi:MULTISPECIES: thioredoxin [Clostridiaceae]|uniref:Thioredoxin n=1 Tax=Clostridium facile TaxID=2763035 RepID=A0ABR7IPX4_9CLOT|nr:MULTISPECIES: thioredoxin [Clostridiaceae]MBC5787200.1 thioredoxin [Clostridium facile]PWN00702.1 MAG: thioredoxin [Massilioclostridium sp.]